MIYVLIGSDNYFIKEKISELTQDNYQIVSLKKDKDYLIQIEKIINQTLFANPPFVVLIDLDKIKISDEIINKFRRGNFILIFKTKPQLLVKKLKNSQITYQEISIKNLNFKNELSFKLFLQEYLKRKKIDLPEKIITSLAKIFLVNPYLLINELKKIEKIKFNNPQEILILIKWPNESMIFHLIDDLIEGKYSDFILRLKREVNLGTP
ncbi:MAG: hypothetical protein NZ866_02520, partial [Patescibacteria group bacterium]|nr:hypothetical protein [Patescibacteria group bacterium]